jgi:hypothetical protein
MAEDVIVGDAVRFLEFLFGEKPQGYIRTFRFNSNVPDGADKNDPKYNRSRNLEYPQALEESNIWIDAVSDGWDAFFSTCTVDAKDAKRGESSLVACPCLWFDVDAAKEIPVSTSNLFAEITDQEEPSALVKSSKKGIQGYFKLDQAVILGGKKGAYKEKIHDVLLDMALYYGGDLKVVSAANLMRMPGTVNWKKVYKEPPLVKSRIYDNRVFSLDELKKRFPRNENICPYPVWLGLADLLTEVHDDWTKSGARHQIMLDLAGTLRKSGLNREATKDAIVRICKYLRYDDVAQEITGVDTTYDKDFDDGIRTLGSEYEVIAPRAFKICEWWSKYKEAWCKKAGIKWKPDNYDPRTAGTSKKGEFWEDNTETWFMSIDKQGNAVPKKFANFVIRPKGRLYDPVTREKVMVAEIVLSGETGTLIEMPPDKHNSWQQFSKIRGLPSGIACYDKVMWDYYIGFLREENKERSHKTKVRYYGFFDVDKEPSLVMPETEHPKYTWINNGTDTARNPKALLEVVSEKKIAKYLQQFAQHYPNYHEERYAIPALGWFAATVVAQFIRKKEDGFTTLMISGYQGSGKSTLVQDILAPHFGAKDPVIYSKASNFSRDRILTANNIVPFIVDEFRDVDPKMTGDMQNTIRGVWDQQTRSFGRMGGEVIEEKLVGSLCLLGEHQYNDPATVERTFSIRVDKTWIHALKKKSPEEQAAWQAHSDWLRSPEHENMMGRIVLQWVQENIELINPLIDAAHEYVKKTTPIPNDRKNAGFVAIVTGILLLKSIYRDFGLDFFVTSTTLSRAIYSADTRLADFKEEDTNAMRILFQATDFLLVSNKNKFIGSGIFHFDPENPTVVHFDIGRWAGMLAEHQARHTIAALGNQSALKEMLVSNSRNEETVIIGFDQSPKLRTNSVTLHVEKIIRKYKVNVDQWRAMEDEEKDY